MPGLIPLAAYAVADRERKRALIVSAQTFTDLSKLPELKLQPGKDDSECEFHTEDGVWIKQILLPEARMFVGQHAHAHAHATMVARGKVRVWVDDELLGDFQEPGRFWDKHLPAKISIVAGKKHTMMSLEFDTIIYCIHNLHDEGQPEVIGRSVFPG